MDIFNNSFTLTEWIESKRRETLDLFLKEEYGYRLIDDSIKLKYEIVESKIINNINIQKIKMTFIDFDMFFYLYMPNDNKKHGCFVFPLHELAEIEAKEDHINDYQTISYIPIDNIINRGYGVAILPTRYLAGDYASNTYPRTKDIYEMVNKEKEDTDWGALQAWSFGCSKVADYLCSLNNIDTSKLAVIGHSRGGKCALLTGAQDERFILIVSSCSGCSGAALSRGNKGERIHNIVNQFDYWFCKNYQKYARKERFLPFDQHQLIGLMAPRYVYIFSADKDKWACPKNELKASRLASQYFNLYGVDGLIAPTQIEKDTSYNEGHIAYHIKRGNHSIEPRDWKMVMDFFDKI